jgi:hypothetical protein
MRQVTLLSPGGGAMIVRGDIQRQTRDLDFFGLTAEELAVDKVLAVFGRAEARDFADLMAVEPRYGLDRLCQLAAEKDRGFLLSVFADMLNQFGRLRRDEFELDDAGYEQLRRTVERWHEQAIELARRQNPEELGPAEP